MIEPSVAIRIRTHTGSRTNTPTATRNSCRARWPRRVSRPMDPPSSVRDPFLARPPAEEPGNEHRQRDERDHVDRSAHGEQARSGARVEQVEAERREGLRLE